jgi:hypothetical protein
MASNRIIIPTSDGQINSAQKKEDGVYDKKSSYKYVMLIDTYYNLLENG